MTDLRTQLIAELGHNYLIEQELGGGGMSRVFVAEDRALGRKVVIKVLPEDLGTGFSVDRFRREIRLAANLQHPHIVPLLTAGGDALLYYTMPLVQGESLRARLDREGELPIGTGLRIMRDVADALASAHAQGIVHRDIKPDNVLISGAHAMVTDFGVAKALAEGQQHDGSGLTSTGLALGTPAYMAPEQAAADPHVDHRADIYALGAMAYEMFTSSPPFVGTTAQQVLAAQVTRTPEPIGVRRPAMPASVAALVMKCLEKSPADRWQSAREIVEELERIGTPPSGSSPTVPVQRIAKQKGWPIAAGLTLVSLLVIGAWLWHRSSRPTAVIDDNVIAVLPFRVTGTDASYGEGMVDLLAAKLTGEGGPRATDPQSVMSAWRSAGGRNDLPREQAIVIARRLGAGKLLQGSVVGTPNQLTLTASVLNVSTGKEENRGEISGSPDSLMPLVDRLAAQLLAGVAGESGHRLAKLTSTSLPALRAYLAGQSSYRRGGYEDAIGDYSRAIEMDSTFALAAIGLASATNWLGSFEERDRAFALAGRLRTRLSTRDAAFLDMKMTSVGYPSQERVGDWSKAAQRLVDLAPESAEGWYELGDSYFHEGALSGLSQAESFARALAAFQQATLLDSLFAAPLEHQIEIAAIAGDTARLRALALQYFQIDSTGDLADFMRWRVATGLNDTARMTSLRGRFAQVSPGSLIRIFGTALLDGIDVTSADSALAHAKQFAEARGRSLDYIFGAINLAINRGRIGETRAYYQQMRTISPIDAIEGTIWDAVVGDGDTTLALESIQLARPIARESLASDPARRSDQYRIACALSVWGVTRGDSAGLGSMLGRLERPLLPQSRKLEAEGLHACGVAVKAWIAADQNSPAALTLIQHVDTTLALVGLPVAHLLSMRVRERMGDTTGALAILRKRRYHWNSIEYLAPILREEGRLAAMTGDRPGAIRAYQHYLRLRENAEPRLQPQVAMVKEELSKLLGE